MRGCHAQIEDDVEKLAAEAFSALEDRSTTVQPAREHPEQCLMCRGIGLWVGKWTHLWGHNCWGCGGSGVVMSGYRGLRGPFRAAPGRRMTMGGGS